MPTWAWVVIAIAIAGIIALCCCLKKGKKDHELPNKAPKSGSSKSGGGKHSSAKELKSQRSSSMAAKAATPVNPAQGAAASGTPRKKKAIRTAPPLLTALSTAAIKAPADRTTEAIRAASARPPRRAAPEEATRIRRRIGMNKFGITQGAGLVYWRQIIRDDFIHVAIDCLTVGVELIACYLWMRIG